MSRSPVSKAPPRALLGEQASIGGVQRFHRRASAEIGRPMRFALLRLRPQAAHDRRMPLPVCLAAPTAVEDHLRHHAARL